MVIIGSRRNRVLQIGLVLSMVVLLIAATTIGLSIARYRDADRNRNSLSAVWRLSEAVVDLHRFRQVISTYQLDDGTVAVQDVRAAFAALEAHVPTLEGPEYQNVFKDDPRQIEAVQNLTEGVRRLSPLIERLDDEAAVHAARRHFEVISDRLAAATAVANRRAAALSDEDFSGLKSLQRTFVGAVLGVVLLAAFMIALLLRQNRLLTNAHGSVTRLAQSLADTTSQLEAAHKAVAVANRELTAHNERLSAREAEARVQSRRFADALENMREGLSMFDATGRLIVCNRRYAEMYGFPDVAALPGTPVAEIVAHYRVSGLIDAQTAAGLCEIGSLKQPETVHFDLGNGRVYEVHRMPLQSGGWVATHEDITERRRVEARLEYLAGHDALTGLANRANFVTRLSTNLVDLAESPDKGDRVGVISFDLDRFKQVNDMFGHAAGDQILYEVARRAEDVVGDRGAVARFGGDEFAIALDPVQTDLAVVEVAEQLIAGLSEPFQIAGSIVEIGTSVGIAIAPDHGSDPLILIRRADTALYEAKAAGRRIYRRFDIGMDERLIERRALEADLKRALAEDRLELRFQPIVNVHSEQIVAAEALLRWNHPLFGWVPPDTFIPIAEESGLIVRLGEWVLMTACRTAAAWPPDVKLSVNLSAAQLKNQGLVPIIVRALAESGLPAERLELEMTETVLFDEDAALEVMRSLRLLGVTFSLDDFGTGYSSLSYLRRFEFDQIKIDKSFLRDSPNRPDCQAIVHAIGALGRTLGIDTVAEGIETPGELEIVRAAGCQYGQGYLFGRPMSAEELSRRLDGEAEAKPAAEPVRRAAEPVARRLAKAG